MKQTLEEFITAYRQQAGPVCNELWDEKDTEYVTNLWRPTKDEEPSDNDS